MELKKKLKEYNLKKPYYPTEEVIRYWFAVINRQVFDNALMPFSKIVVKRIPLAWGYVYYDDEIKSPPLELHMSMKLPNKPFFINILAHEMVHKWQLDINGDTGNHNKHFYSWKQAFNENGLILTRSL